MRKLRPWLLLLLAVLVVGLFFFLPELLGPRLGHEPHSPVAGSEMKHPHQDADSAQFPETAPDSDCVLRQGRCELHLADGKQLRLSLAPTPTPTMEPVTFEVALQGFDAQEVKVKIQGRDMYMGEQNVRLEQRQPGLFVGELIIPACTTGHGMVWLAQVEVQEPRNTYRAVFEFATEP